MVGIEQIPIEYQWCKAKDVAELESELADLRLVRIMNKSVIDDLRADNDKLREYKSMYEGMCK